MSTISPAAPRPSLLPKWAECAAYEPTPGEAGPAAQRGTRMDSVYRAVMAGREPEPEDLANLCADDISAVRWAADMTRLYAGAEVIHTEEADCRVPNIPGIPAGGTADAVIPGLSMSLDLKSGQIRNYREQMAAYALGFMEAAFTEEWTTALLFCDRREVFKTEWTYDSARRCVEEVLAARNAPDIRATPCDYCGWCAFSDTCAARMDAAESALAVSDDRFQSILADPAKLGEFLAACATVEKYQDTAKTKAREILESGGEVPGWKLRAGGATKQARPLEIGHHFDRLVKEVGFGKFLDACGPMSAAKWEGLWKEINQPVPDGSITAAPRASSLVREKAPARKISLKTSNPE